MSWSIRWEFEPRNLWIGASWETRHYKPDLSLMHPPGYRIEWHLWFCLVPCFPLHITYESVTIRGQAQRLIP